MAKLSVIAPLIPGGDFPVVEAEHVGVNGGNLKDFVDNAEMDLDSKADKSEVEAAFAAANVELGKKANKTDVNTELAKKENTSDVDAKLAGKVSNSEFNAFKNRTDNPHSVTKAQVGLENVNNTSDLDKPISTATQIEINKKADKTEVAAELVTKANKIDVETALSNKADKSAMESLQSRIDSLTASEVGALPSEDYDFIDVSSLSNFDISDVVDGAKMAGKMLYFPKGTTKQIDYAHSHDLVGNLCGGGNIFTRNSDNTAPDIYKMPVENIGDNIQTDMNFWSVADSRLIYPHSKYSGFLWNRELFDLDRFEYIVPWMTFTVDENYIYPQDYVIPETTIITIKPFVVVGYNKVTHQLEHLFNIPISSGSTRNIITNVGQEGVKPTQKDGYQEYSISSDVFNDMYLHCWSGTISYLNATSRFKDVEYVGIMCEVSTNRLGIIGHLGLDQKNTSDNQGQEVGGSRFKYISSVPTNLWFSNCLNDADVYEAVQNKLVTESISDNHYISAFKKANNDRNVNTTSGSDKTKTFTLAPNSLYYILATPVASDGSMGGASDAMSALVYTNSKKAYIQPIVSGNGNSSITVNGLTLTSTTISSYCLHSVIRLSAIPV